MTDKVQSELDNEIEKEIAERIIANHVDKLCVMFLGSIEKIINKSLHKDKAFLALDPSSRVTIITSIVGTSLIFAYANLIGNTTQNPGVASAAFGNHAIVMKKIFDGIVEKMMANSDIDFN